MDLNQLRPDATPCPDLTRDVVIAGGGPAGAAVALLLARSGAHVTVLERVAEPRSLGAGILLQPNGLGVLYGLGLRDALQAGAHRSTTGSVRDAHDRVLVRTEVPDFGHGLDHVLALRRSHLADVLAAAMADEPGIQLVTGAEVIGVDANGAVRFRRDRRVQEIGADVVVGADGAWSAIRQRGRFGGRMRATGHTYARTIVDGAPEVGAGEIWTSLGLFGVSPLGDGSSYLYADASATPVARAVQGRDLAGFTAAWARALPIAAPLLERIASFDALRVDEVRRVDCDRYVDGRMVLVGDAAHAMAPTLGQGANSALVDAAVLAVCLGRHDTATALRTYDERRRPAVRVVQRDAERVARLAGLRSSGGRALRDRALRAVDRPRAGERRFRALQQERPDELLRAVAAIGATRTRALA
jgi:2-polyprenyl-6-methoxyphenol hydroxylase-like FAD-dependent oxidoreductase